MGCYELMHAVGKDEWKLLCLMPLFAAWMCTSIGQMCIRDRCTAAEAVGGEVPASAYWCVYIAEPGASTGMLVSLEASRFSAEDTVRLAQSLSR